MMTMRQYRVQFQRILSKQSWLLVPAVSVAKRQSAHRREGSLRPTAERADRRDGSESSSYAVKRTLLCISAASSDTWRAPGARSNLLSEDHRPSQAHVRTITAGSVPR